MTDAYMHAKSIVVKLVKAGHVAYFAGGWVRDYVMGHPSEDIDIATDASPAIIMDLFPHTLLVGLAFGIVIVVIEGHQYEVATFRKDLHYLDGRHPQGIELATPLEDALRRDFTINGMFYDPLEEVIHDYVEGQRDIRLGIIRTIGDPHERFFEDRLRILRAFRFAARFAFTIEAETQEAIRVHADRLFPAVAIERVWQEFNKMAAYPRFDQALVDMHRLGVLGVIFPEINSMHLKDLRQRVQSFAFFPPSCPTILYLMEVLHALPFHQKIAIAKRMKVSNKDLKLIEWMEQVACAFQEQKMQQVDVYRWAILLAHPYGELCLNVLIAQEHFAQARENLQEFYQKLFKRLEPHIRRLRLGKPLISAALLEQHGIKPGKQMGLLLKEAERIAVTENWQEAEPVIAKLATLPLWKSAS